MQAPVFNKAVLLVSFRRADLTARVLEVLRRVRPVRLYLATDAARSDRDTDVAGCLEVRRVLDTFVQSIDWPCETVRRADASANLGARRRMISAISWMLEHEPEGIILEDDCLPLESFFPYCADLLERYRDEPRVMSIGGGRGGEAGEPEAVESFYFSKYPRIWGWATWRRAWALYDEHLAGWEDFQRTGELDKWCFHPQEKAHHVHLVNLTLHGGLDAWDYQWLISCWMHRGLSIVPKMDQIVNIGFRDDATHTTLDSHGWIVQDARAMEFPLRVPAEVREDRRRDLGYWKSSLEGPSLPWRVSRRLRAIGRGAAAWLIQTWERRFGSRRPRPADAAPHTL